MISPSIQYERKPLYFCISNISHQCRLIAMHCIDTIPPAAHMSLHNCLLTLHIQVTPFTQHHFDIEQSVCNLGHFQQFRWCLIEPATIHMQWHSQNLVKPAPPPYYCGDIVVLFIVLYCITIAAVSHLTCPVASTTSHTTHHWCYAPHSPQNQGCMESKESSFYPLPWHTSSISKHSERLSPPWHEIQTCPHHIHPTLRPHAIWPPNLPMLRWLPLRPHPNPQQYHSRMSTINVALHVLQCQADWNRRDTASSKTRWKDQMEV